MQERESEIQSAILDYLRRFKHIMCWRNNSGAFVKGEHFVRFGLKGSPDIIGILPDGRFLGIEVKRPGKHPTPEQEEFIKMATDRGGMAFVAHSLNEVIQQLG